MFCKRSTMAFEWDNRSHPDVYYYVGVPQVPFTKCKILNRSEYIDFYSPTTYAYHESCSTLWMYGDGLYRIDHDTRHCNEEWRFVRIYIKDLQDLDKVYSLITRERMVPTWEKFAEFIKNNS